MSQWERGQVATGRYEVSNPGDQDLVLDGVRSSCSCAGLEVDGEDGPTRVTSLRIGPGQRAELQVRMVVNGRAGATQSSVVYAATNVPGRPEVGFRLSVARITGGLEVRPQGVAVGRVTVGSRAVHVIEVIDRSPSPRSLTKVTTVGGGITARLLPRGDGDPEIVGRVEVTVDTTTARPVDGQVFVWPPENGTAGPLGVAVSGRVVPAVPPEG